MIQVIDTGSEDPKWAALISNAKKGDENSRTDLYTLSIVKVSKEARTMVGNPRILHDIIQQAYYWSFAHLDQCHDPEHYIDWMIENIDAQLRKRAGKRGKPKRKRR